MEGTLPLFSFMAQVLVDTGASHSFISKSCQDKLNLSSVVATKPLMVVSPLGKKVRIDQICESCVLRMGDLDIVYNFFLIEMTDFDIILGMDWLTAHQVLIVCLQRKIYGISPTIIRFVEKLVPYVNIRVQFSSLKAYSGRIVASMGWEDVEGIEASLPRVVCEFPDKLSGLPPHAGDRLCN